MVSSPYEQSAGYPRSFHRAMELHAETPAFRERVAATKNEVSEIVQEHPRPRTYVAFSGGKDSTVLLHLAEDCAPGEVACFHWDYGAYLIPRPVEAEILGNARSLISPGRIIVRCRPAQRSSRDGHAVGYRAFFATLAMLTKERGWTAGLVGFRAEESCTRTRRVERAGREGEWHSGQQCRLFYPLQDWTWRDVYAYLITRDLPILGVYHAYAELVGYDQARFVTFFDSEFAALGNANLDGHVLPGFKHL